MEIDGTVCIVTGASSGIGEATARLLAARGASVVLAARRADRLHGLADELPGSLAVRTDVTDPDQVRTVVDRTLDAFGRVDVLVNNAGQGLHLPLAEVDPADLRAVHDLNVVGPLLCMQAVLPTMTERGSGAIVNVSSATALRVFPGLGAYAATKAALGMLSQVARAELADAGVAVSVVYPSLTATEFHSSLRAGTGPAPGAASIPADPPQLPARAIAHAIETGAAHVLAGDPPTAFEPGSEEGWGALLARQDVAQPAGAHHPG